MRLFVKEGDYPVMVEPTAEGGFVAGIFDLVGCCSHGLTEEEAVRSAREAAKAWIDEAKRLGRAINQPSPIKAEGPNVVRETS